MNPSRTFDVRRHLLAGQVIPALPLALDRARQWSPRHQRALVRYYVESGAGGLAVGVHSTQFEIRDRHIGLFEPVLSLAVAEAMAWREKISAPKPFLMISGLCGKTRQAIAEATLARSLGYRAGLLSLGAWRTESEHIVLRHCRRVAKELPLIGFYLQPAVGGRIFSHRFWRAFSEIPELVAIKVAPFDRYRTLDVVRALIAADREDVALYTGNDDNIIADLLTPFEFGGKVRYFNGGLLGQWGVWTKGAVEMFGQLQRDRGRRRLDPRWLSRNAELTDANAAIFDSAHGFAGCLPGIHEVLRRNGLLPTTACLNPREKLSPGQADEITRVSAAYPWLRDDSFVARNLKRWLT